MTEIVFGSSALRALSAALEAETERGAALYLQYDEVGDRYLVREIEVAEPADQLSATKTEITFAPQFLTRITRRARERRQHLALLHTHPEGYEYFSPIDDGTEQGLVQFMRTRNPGNRTFAMVMCGGKLRARFFGTFDDLPVREVGAVVVLGQSGAQGATEAERYDRQVRAIGTQGQIVLKGLTVAIVGLGGTGSVAAEQLAHLGVGRFILIDPDTVEESNLNRVVGAKPSSVGDSKIFVASQMIGNVRPETYVQGHAGSVISHDARRMLSLADCIFICTDSHSSRAFLAELCYQYLIPAFDIGVSINAQRGEVRAITGRTQMLAPGLPCLLCTNALDARVIREELMSPEQRAADPYFNEGGVKQPAVISINSAMVSLAVTMFLAAFTGLPARARWQSYDALAGTIRTLTSKPDPDCSICGPRGIAGAADSRTLNFLVHPTV